MGTRFGIAQIPCHLGATKGEEKDASKFLVDGGKGEGTSLSEAGGKGKAPQRRWGTAASSACSVAQQGVKSAVTLTTVSSERSSELEMMMLVSSAEGTGGCSSFKTVISAHTVFPMGGLILPPDFCSKGQTLLPRP